MVAILELWVAERCAEEPEERQNEGDSFSRGCRGETPLSSRSLGREEGVLKIVARSSGAEQVGAGLRLRTASFSIKGKPGCWIAGDVAISRTGCRSGSSASSASTRELPS